MSSSDLRHCPITGQPVIFAPNRAQRPQQRAESHAELTADEECPFCEGQEHETPGEVWAVRNDGTSPDGPGWQVRVVPNKYPALARHDVAGQAPGYGVHEVFIESPRHITRMSQLPLPQWEALLLAYQTRLTAVREEGKYPYAQIFKNAGLAAGATLEHVHSQLLATPEIPPTVQRELDAAQAYHTEHGRCIFCDLVERELAAGERVIAATDDFVALAPYASRTPYETWILPRRHASRFEAIGDAQRSVLASTLRSVTDVLERVLEPAAYNWLIHTSPFDTSDCDHYHWHIEVLPRVTHLAGFEWATGCYINIVTPEDAASVLRSAQDP